MKQTIPFAGGISNCNSTKRVSDFVLSAAVLVLSAAVLVLSAAVLVLESRRKPSKNTQRWFSSSNRSFLIHE
jgi:lipopolysaccharide/colanic/teichoic acid biosynthesis glycosyltransferase